MDLLFALGILLLFPLCGVYSPAVPFMGPFMGINGRLPMLILC